MLYPNFSKFRIHTSSPKSILGHSLMKDNNPSS